MGFRAPRSTLTLKFAESEYEGFEVVIRRMTIDDTLVFNEYDIREWEKRAKNGEFTKEEIDARYASMWATMAEAIVSWNLVDDGDNPIPVSVAAVRAQESDFFWTLVRAWIMGMMYRVDGDLKAPSSDGKPLEEQLIPMEPLSENLAS